MKRSVALISVAALFLVGIVTGVLATHLFQASWHPGAFRGGRPPEFPRGPRGPHPLPPHLVFAERLHQHLNLTPEQERAVEAIIEETTREADVIREEVRPKLERQTERARARIAELLTPEQLEVFDRVHDRHRRRMQHRLHDP